MTVAPGPRRPIGSTVRPPMPASAKASAAESATAARISPTTPAADFQPGSPPTTATPVTMNRTALVPSTAAAASLPVAAAVGTSIAPPAASSSTPSAGGGEPGGAPRVVSPTAAQVPASTPI